MYDRTSIPQDLRPEARSGLQRIPYSRATHFVMGVKGLLTQLKPLRTFTNAYSRQRGKRLGVDISVWLHQIALHHAAEIVEGEYANFVVSVVGRAKRFAEEGVGLHMVFDGAHMPGKSGCKVKRDERRAKSLAFTSSAESKVDQKQYEAALKAAIQIPNFFVPLTSDRVGKNRRRRHHKRE
jgi:hypothetical protein